MFAPAALRTKSRDTKSCGDLAKTMGLLSTGRVLNNMADYTETELYNKSSEASHGTPRTGNNQAERGLRTGISF